MLNVERLMESILKAIILLLILAIMTGVFLIVLTAIGLAWYLVLMAIIFFGYLVWYFYR